MTNIQIAELISERIGDSPIPFDSVRGLALEIYQELGGTEDDEHFEDIYQILLETLPLIGPTENIIDDSVIAYNKTWSSHKINDELSSKATIDDEDISTGTTFSSSMIDTCFQEFFDNISIIFDRVVENADASLALKADKTELADYATLNDISTFITANDVSIYATKSYVDTSLALKQDVLIPGANITIQNNVISATGGTGGAVIDDYNVSTGTTYSSQKIEDISSNIYTDFGNAIEAVVSDVNRSLGLKADKTYVDASLANKANVSDLANYATITNVDASLALKADKTQLADYATIVNVDASLALKANSSDLANYATIANVDASLANYATITNVDSSLATKATLVILTQAQYDALATKDSSTLYIISDAN